MKDYPGITKLISDIIVNELKFKLEYDDLDSESSPARKTMLSTTTFTST